MDILDYAFILGCSLAGWLIGFLAWKLARRGRGKAGDAATTQKPDAVVERQEPPVIKPSAEPTEPQPVARQADFAPAVEIQQSLKEILQLIKDAAAARAPAEDRLLAEIRAAISAEDPAVRKRLDRISEALNIPSDDDVRIEMTEEADSDDFDPVEVDPPTGDGLEEWQEDIETPDTLEAEPVPEDEQTDTEVDADPIDDASEGGDVVEERIVRQISVP